MSEYKPKKRRDYEKEIRRFGWYLEKAGNDWKLMNKEGKLVVRNIIITHPGNEVIASSVKKTYQALTDAGLLPVKAKDDESLDAKQSQKTEEETKDKTSQKAHQKMDGGQEHDPIESG